jgi:hypothetical protein
VFGVAELLAPALGLWEPRGSRELGGTALYVLPAEAVLGAAVVAAARTARTTRERLLAAPAVALLYSGEGRADRVVGLVDQRLHTGVVERGHARLLSWTGP